MTSAPVSSRQSIRRSKWCLGVSGSYRLASAWVFLARALSGGVLLWSGLVKVRQPFDFLQDVYAYEIVGPKGGLVMAMTLPWLEVLLAVCLLGGVVVGGALLGAALLFAMFTAAVGSAIIRELSINCGCFGGMVSDGPIGYATALRTVLLLAVAVVGYCYWLGLETRRAAVGRVE